MPRAALEGCVIYLYVIIKVRVPCITMGGTTGLHGFRLMHQCLGCYLAAGQTSAILTAFLSNKTLEQKLCTKYKNERGMARRAAGTSVKGKCPALPSAGLTNPDTPVPKDVEGLLGCVV